MKTVGIVAEYNPFHNGHRYHITATQKASGCENILVVMSGNYVQRGEPALFDKWTRTRMALLNGADMVLELPTLFSTQTAETFAYSAVKLLQDSGIADGISFGSESGNLDLLHKTAGLLKEESPLYQENIREALAKGLSFPAARQKALEKTLDLQTDLLSSANNILGIEYLKALDKLRSSLKPITVARQGAGYHSLDLKQGFASATGLRKEILENRSGLNHLDMPKSAIDLGIQAIESGRAPITLDAFSSALFYRLSSLTAAELAETADISEGLENRILKEMAGCTSISGLMSRIKTKRYTFTRLQRALLHILLGITQTDTALHREGSPYIRVLGFRKEREYLLSEMVKKAAVPVLVNFKELHSFTDEKIVHLLNLESKCTNIYFSAAPNPAHRKLNEEYTNSVVII